MNLKNKTALITGGSSGIGKAIARAFIEKGAKVIIFGINKPDYNCEFYHVDVSKEEQIKKALNNIKSLDIVINNAGIFKGKLVEKTTAEELNEVLDIDFKGAFLVCKHSIPKLNKGGCIINISSILGIAPRAEASVYSASKAAVISLTKALALELANKSIRVNSIAPGIIDTPIWEKFAGSKEEGDKDMKESSSHHPLKRAGKPEEIAHAAIFLAENEFTTGIILPVDGGATI
ncbi:MAG TPA: SDR family NAD(P)-dependent oxidoreductase [Candidatus Nanoarchaeia archaeon]|nr:SDR family oxidoreductase [Nanoarchaeota archaeon]HLC54651.1 SDR family NAD(P)-dependent oxidoreductase [Candidatus Nanoarchaeia archaeon]